MVFTQDEAFLLYLVFWVIDMEAFWAELVHGGVIMAPERPLIPAVRFCLMTHGNTNAKLDFRFDVQGVRSLPTLFGLPETIITGSNDRCNNLEAVSIMLFRLSFPRQHHDMSSSSAGRQAAYAAYSCPWEGPVFVRMQVEMQDDYNATGSVRDERMS
ncbi:hypothetical protein PR002_g14996 [Phytophthora rubi]|uniref:Uncharacterized protein n=1 Tax=Phytophthora rubi TaxID=129364 RepID=A0A6A3KY55_9STRA|nr:hypothetical protein PR002_g14996 [Phytophthora rubi]